MSAAKTIGNAESHSPIPKQSQRGRQGLERIYTPATRQDAVLEMSIRLRNGYVVNREPLMGEDGKVPMGRRAISVLHPEGGG